MLLSNRWWFQGKHIQCCFICLFFIKFAYLHLFSLCDSTDNQILYILMPESFVQYKILKHNIFVLLKFQILIWNKKERLPIKSRTSKTYPLLSNETKWPLFNVFLLDRFLANSNMSKYMSCFDFFFLSCHSKFHMNWTSFKRSLFLQDHFFFVPKVTS
jgi:hypothetical protein